MSKEKSPTNIARAELPIDRAKERFGDVHRKLGEAWDLLRVGRQRAEEAQRAAASRRSSDATRAPALDNPRAVR
ncbi:hypothetical protein [Nocardioides sp. TF02-7]|uniref:hypothetical protein n=1 Tax=Nocardioides sp. TF02-7 TaxID=2917724 RepID=UPI001F0575D6|nr:hypothetical protein [Nocardioides sp. TF02-7]UMG92844.1 hypothetical protein MF408_00140 [Nocardioides sp. TF02-7]